MKKNQILSFAAAMLLTVSLAAGSGYAAGGGGGQTQPAAEGNVCGPNDSFRQYALRRYDRFFDGLVSEGIISAGQKGVIKSSIEAAVNEARQNDAWRIDMSTILASLVREGALTAEQRAAIENALRSERLEAVRRRVKAVLNTMVKAGTITETQEKAILSAIDDAVNSGGGKLELHALLESLARYGVITGDQRLAIEDAVKPAHHGKGLCPDF